MTIKNEVERLTADNVAKQEQLDRFEALADKKIDRLLAEQQRLEGALGLSMAREVRQSAVVEAPTWEQYIEITRNWLEIYPLDIFTGISGDSGPLFVVAVREALAALDQTK